MSDNTGFVRKAAAFIAEIILVIVMVIAGITVIAAFDNNWWANPGADYRQSQMVRSAVARKEWEAVDYYENFGADFGDAWVAAEDYTNYRFRLTAEDGTVLYDSIDEETCILYPQPAALINDGTTIESAAVSDPKVQDGIYWAMVISKSLLALKPAAVPVLCAAFLVFIILLIYLSRRAGRRPGSDGLYPTFWEKIPLDLYLFCSFLLISAMITLIAESSYSSDPSSDLIRGGIIGIASAGIAVVSLMTWMTLAVRFKMGGWWRNSLTYLLVHFGGKGIWKVLKSCALAIRGSFRALPLIWKFVVGYLIFMIMIMTAALHRSPDHVLWLLIAGGAVLGFAAFQLRKLQKASEALAGGELGQTIDTKHLYWDFRKHGDNLNAISEGMTTAVEERLKSERLKTELITNVSHDIKTPLTSIINYVDLLKRETDPEKQKDYLTVLDRQSHRLKKLTEDLVEVSKAATGNVEVKASLHSMNELLRQAVGEYSERFEAARLEPVLTVPDREVFAFVDGTLMWRVVDNLLSNACKYALDGTRFYIDMTLKDGNVVMSFKNVSRDRLNIPAEELMERFVRGDRSRTGQGSGLGLNIARSLVELQGGTFSLHVDGDLFKAEITVPAGR